MLSKEYKPLWITCALPDKNSKTSGRAKFKGKYYYNYFSYPQLSNVNVVKNTNGRYCVNTPYSLLSKRLSVLSQDMLCL